MNEDVIELHDAKITVEYRDDGEFARLTTTEWNRLDAPASSTEINVLLDSDQVEQLYEIFRDILQVQD